MNWIIIKEPENGIIQEYQHMILRSDNIGKLKYFIVNDRNLSGCKLVVPKDYKVISERKHMEIKNSKVLTIKLK